MCEDYTFQNNENEWNDVYSYADTNNTGEQQKMLWQLKRCDRGFNRVVLSSNFNKKKYVDIYTSSGTGNRIRDAETGEYYPNLVGSKDEDIFFKVSVSSGHCNSANSSNTLFYSSPQQYSSHFCVAVNQEIINNWERKRDARLLNKIMDIKSRTMYTTIK